MLKVILLSFLLSICADGRKIPSTEGDVNQAALSVDMLAENDAQKSLASRQNFNNDQEATNEIFNQQPNKDGFVQTVGENKDREWQSGNDENKPREELIPKGGEGESRPFGTPNHAQHCMHHPDSREFHHHHFHQRRRPFHHHHHHDRDNDNSRDQQTVNGTPQTNIGNAKLQNNNEWSDMQNNQNGFDQQNGQDNKQSREEIIPNDGEGQVIPGETPTHSPDCYHENHHEHHHHPHHGGPPPPPPPPHHHAGPRDDDYQQRLQKRQDQISSVLNNDPTFQQGEMSTSIIGKKNQTPSAPNNQDHKHYHHNYKHHHHHEPCPPRGSNDHGEETTSDEGIKNEPSEFHPQIDVRGGISRNNDRGRNHDCDHQHKIGNHRHDGRHHRHGNHDHHHKKHNDSEQTQTEVSVDLDDTKLS